MLLAVTILAGAALGWAAEREGALAIMLLAMASAAGLTVAGYLIFLFKNWRLVLSQLSSQGVGAFQWDTLRILVWSFILRSFLMGAAGLVTYWISATLR
jgi:hypothetical protein